QGTNLQDLARESLEPSAQRCLAAVSAVGRQDNLDELRGMAEVLSEKGVPDRLGDVTFFLLPGRGLRVELEHEAGSLVEEPPAQDVGEEVVVAVPVTTIVQGDDEQVVPFQGL